VTPLRIPFAAILLALLAASPAWAQRDWGKRMFQKTSHEFGTVARGAKVECRFPFENVFEEDVRVTSVKSTCGCTLVKSTKDVLKMYDTAEVVAEVDTRRFIGFKESTITVVLESTVRGRLAQSEVQLHIRSFIRGDVVFEPGLVQFETVEQGKGAARRVTVTYAGRSDWKIVDATSTASFLTATLKEVGRNRDASNSASTQVTYDLVVTLRDDAPPGYFKEILLLKTDDPNKRTAQVPLTVEGLVSAPLTARPSVLLFGQVEPGDLKKKVLVLEGVKAFRIQEVTGPDDRFTFSVSQESAKEHLMVVRFNPKTTPGRVTGKIRIKTDMSSAPVEVGVDAEVVAPADGSKPAAAAADASPSSPTDDSPLPRPTDSTTPRPKAEKTPLLFTPKS
jgi:hypothetical protein